MVYSSFGILAVVIHVILNYDVIKNGRQGDPRGPRFRYRQFINALLIFYIADMLWGFMVDSGIRFLAYADTWVFFASMALSVLLWTRYVVAFLNRDGVRAASFLAAGWCIFGFVILQLIINFFEPIVFDFSKNVEYFPGFGRYIILAIQVILFILISIYSFFVSNKAEGREKVHYLAVCVTGGIMAVFIVVQTLYPFAPFYTIGCMIANCMLHVFVEEDEKKEQTRINVDTRKERDMYSQIASGLALDYDSIYYIEIESGNYIEISSTGPLSSMDVPKSGDNFYKEAAADVARFAHPDDRAFARSMYNKDNVKKKLEQSGSYFYKYRLMIGEEARYFSFRVMLSEDGKHFALCVKDIQDTITAETELLEEKKNNITFSRIAESLAANYDVIYYINTESGEYVGYNSKSIYGELMVDESGEDFFGDVRKNAGVVIHPEDRERILTVLDRDNLLTALEGKRQVNHQYRLFIDGKIRYARLSVRKASDEIHLIIGVENIDEEVRKEKEHLRALNTEKELARRDELTGIKNKTAFTELEQSIQNSIENGRIFNPFALAVCDLNDLKMINDTKGHKAGDEYITAASKLLCDVFDHSPVYRVGGDEFVIYLTGDDYALRNKLLDMLRKLILNNIDKHEGPVIAVGMAEYDPSVDSNVSDIFDRADRMMYEDKRALKDRYT